MAFTHLHLHTEYSFLDGSIKIKELFKHVKALGQTAVAITEHGNMHALVSKYQAAQKEGIKLIFGVEAYICEDIKKKDRKRNHIVLLAETNEGLANLIKLTSIAASEGFYYKPRIDKTLLRKYSKGVICTSSCLAGEIEQAIIHDDYPKAIKITKEYIDIFGENNFFLEVHNHKIPQEAKFTKIAAKIAEELNIKIIAANDAHYLTADDKEAHEILLCIQTKGKLKDEKHFKFNGEGFYVKSEDEMNALFTNNPEYITNTQLIADRCNAKLELGNTYFPDFEIPKGETFETYLTKLCKEGLDIKYKGLPIYEDAVKRMEYELSVINKMGFAAYFLIVADFIRDAKNFCQVGPGRGSGAGSIVAYVLGITQLEPLGLDLLFERFLNPERISLPDFDVDFGDRDGVLEYVRNKYGHDKVALIGTYGTMMAKAVLKDVARVMDIPFDVSNEITKHVNEKTIDKSLELRDERNKLINLELKEYEKRYPKLFEIAKRLEGTVRQPGIHACGVVWGPKPINNYCTTWEKDGITVTQMDKDEVEMRGLVKFDFLGLETLNIIQKVLDYTKKGTEWLEKIPIDDPKIYSMLTRGDSVGVFQLESAGMMKTLKSVRPTCFDDIVAIVSLYRPGSMDYIEVYANRKDGKEKVVYPHPLAEDVLSPTYGILVYQEQVMILSQKLAGFTMGQADTLRKAIGKKNLQLMEKMENAFKEGCKKVANMAQETTNKLWDNIVLFASYSFNKSHAAAYALISYRTAYLKYYYELEFFTALISSVTKDPDKMFFYVQEGQNAGIKFTSPCVNTSELDFTYHSKGGVRTIQFGFSGIKSVGTAAIDEIKKHRPYKDYQDFINKVDLGKVNKRVLKNLILSGGFDNLGHTRAELLNAFGTLKKNGGKSNSGTQMTLFGAVANESCIEKVPEFSLGKILQFEKETLGIPISGHIIDSYPMSKSPRFDKLSSILDETDFSIFAIIKNIKKIVTKKGDDMAFLDIEDKSGSGSLVVFPTTFEKLDPRKLIVDSPIIIEGKKKEGSLIAWEIEFPTINN